MGRIQVHIRNKLVAGLLAAIPIAVTIFILWYVDARRASCSHVHTPFVGIAIAIGTIYCPGRVRDQRGRAVPAAHHRRVAPAGARAERALSFVEAGRAGRHAGRDLRARGAGPRRRGPRLRPRFHQRPRDRGRSGAVVRVRARLAQPDLRQALLRPDHPLHPPGDEPAGGAEADHLGRQLCPRRRSARGRSAATRCPASGERGAVGTDRAGRRSRRRGAPSSATARWCARSRGARWSCRPGTRRAAPAP